MEIDIVVVDIMIVEALLLCDRKCCIFFFTKANAQRETTNVFYDLSSSIQAHTDHVSKNVTFTQHRMISIESQSQIQIRNQ